MQVRIDSGDANLGWLKDIVVEIEGPNAHAVGILVDQRQSGPDQFVPWDRVVDLFEVGIIIQAPDGTRYPPFQPHPGWIQAGRQLIGRKFGISAHEIEETANHLIFGLSGSTLHLEAVDTSLRGPIYRWGLGKLCCLVKGKEIPWKDIVLFLQPPLRVD